MIKVSIKLARKKLVFNSRSVPCLPPHTASHAVDLTGWRCRTCRSGGISSTAFFLVGGENSSKSFVERVMVCQTFQKLV